MPIPQPKASESETDFIERAHRDLAEDYPDTAQRNAIVFKAWRESKGESELDRKAHSMFASDEYDRVDNVPVFIEHTLDKIARGPDGQPKFGDDGQPVKYRKHFGIDDMKAIVRNSNHRIEDTGSFSPLADGHNPSDFERSLGAKSPEVLGFGGPFRLGMIGQKEPRWAIFQTEYRLKSEAEKFRRMPRRSAEVWRANDLSKVIIDPVAVLGAETPRLDMGLTFSRSASGEECLRYSAAAMAGGMDTFAPEHVKPEQYAEQETKTMVSPEDIQAIVAALMETPQMRFVTEQMDARANTSEQEQANVDTPPAGEPNKFGADDGPPAEQESEEDKMKKLAAGEKKPEDEEQRQQYSRERDEEVAKYRRLESEHNTLKSQVAMLARAKTEAERRARLHGLRQHFAFDVDKQLQYSMELSDKGFDGHCEMIRENFSPIPLDQQLLVPALDAPTRSMEQVEADKFSERCASEAITECMRLRSEHAHQAGYEPNYQAVLAGIKEKLAKAS